MFWQNYVCLFVCCCLIIGNLDCNIRRLERAPPLKVIELSLDLLNRHNVKFITLPISVPVSHQIDHVACNIHQWIIFPLRHALHAAGMYLKMNTASSKSTFLCSCHQMFKRETEVHWITFPLEVVNKANVYSTQGTKWMFKLSLFLFSCSQPHKQIQIKEKERQAHTLHLFCFVPKVMVPTALLFSRKEGLYPLSISISG